MLRFNRYKRKPVFDYNDRSWPSKEITKAPIWCSVDLRDGNQALVEPMNVEEKLEMFELLVKLGFKEIEVGFPASSQIEYEFIRTLVEGNFIPEEVTVQVLVQCREHLIDKTFEAIKGLDKAIVHIYNSTSKAQREMVFNKGKEEVKEIAVNAAKYVAKKAKDFQGEIILEYSPECFTDTELSYSLEVCEAVHEAWGIDKKIIINLPATVELNTPNVYADQIEWINNNIMHRDNIILSTHPHNDRGTGVASAELSLLAGAQRVEGTLFGNGERTGNVDLLTMAYNMFSQGINPELNIEDVKAIEDVYVRCTKMSIHPRHPYAGELVFTAFSGSHQDAINKSMLMMDKNGESIWRVPYLPINPVDIGREYEPIVRINSQSGRGGVAYVMDAQFGYKLPKEMHKEFADVIQKKAELQGGEVTPKEIMQIFVKEYLAIKAPFAFLKATIEDNEDNNTTAKINFKYKGKEMLAIDSGNGTIDAVKNAVSQMVDIDVKVMDFSEHALGSGSNAMCVAYIHMFDAKSGRTTFGTGVSTNLTRASIKSFFSGLNRLIGDN